jgi:hypothetical protein
MTRRSGDAVARLVKAARFGFSSWGRTLLCIPFERLEALQAGCRPTPEEEHHLGECRHCSGVLRILRRKHGIGKGAADSRAGTVIIDIADILRPLMPEVLAAVTTEQKRVESPAEDLVVTVQAVSGSTAETNRAIVTCNIAPRPAAARYRVGLVCRGEGNADVELWSREVELSPANGFQSVVAGDVPANAQSPRVVVRPEETNRENDR